MKNVGLADLVGVSRDQSKTAVFSQLKAVAVWPFSIVIDTVKNNCDENTFTFKGLKRLIRTTGRPSIRVSHKYLRFFFFKVNRCR